MAVYVDDMYRHATGRLGRMKMSHMLGDSEDELHAMAARVGVARRWYQGDHYDICLSKRVAAVSAAAQEITWRMAGLMTLFRRKRGWLPSPVEAEAWHAERMRAGPAGLPGG